MIQVAGQPLLTQAPIQQVIHYPTQTPQPIQYQSYQPPVIRMYHHETPHQPNTPIQYLAPTPPSTTPSPGQSHQQFHAGPQPSQGSGAPSYAPPQGPQFQMMYLPQAHPQQIPFVCQQQGQQPQHPIQLIMQQHNPAQ